MGNGKCIEAGILTGGVYSRLIEQHKRVYSVDGCSPTLHTCSGGNEEIKILEEPLGCALRGRYKNGDGTTTQQLEVNESGTSNALTTVQKDSLVIEPLLVGGWAR